MSFLRFGDVAGTNVILAIGIDNLASLEELFGESFADEVMAALAERLRRALPASCELRQTRYRRFILELSADDAGAVAQLFERLQVVAATEAIETSFGPVAVSLSGGCAFMDSMAAINPDLLEPAALQALHGAMARCVGNFEVARDDRQLIAYRAGLVQASRAAMGAIGADSIAIAFQPVVSASGGNTISFHECLVRIRQPGGTLLTAAAFMPALERLGLAPLIDRQVLLLTLEALTRHPNARLSVNIFPQTMQDTQWIELLERGVMSDPSLGERLIVEVTETSAVLEPKRTLDFMDRLRGHGVSFALDDFGSGHTSLRYLRDFRFDMVKFDGRFVRGIRHGSDNAFFIETILRIAGRFDMMTVAEAVQGPAEARCLADLGVEFFQGFYFGSPSLVLEPTPSPMPAVAAQA